MRNWKLAWTSTWRFPGKHGPVFPELFLSSLPHSIPREREIGLKWLVHQVLTSMWKIGWEPMVWATMTPGFLTPRCFQRRSITRPRKKQPQAWDSHKIWRKAVVGPPSQQGTCPQRYFSLDWGLHSQRFSRNQALQCPVSPGQDSLLFQRDCFVGSNIKW